MRKRMRILTHKNRAAVAFALPVFADRLSDREDMRFVESGFPRSPAMPARPETDELILVRWIRLLIEVIAFEPRNVNQQTLGRWFSSQRAQFAHRRLYCPARI